MTPTAMSDTTHDQHLASESTIDLIAGRHPNGELIIEKVLVNPQQQKDSFQLLKSPVFVRGIARADVVQKMDKPEGAFKILQHGGNLCIRVFSKQSLSSPQCEELQQRLTLAIEKLGGDLDIKEDRVLVYSIHVSCGFNAIEKILEQELGNREDMVWYYGNVYDPDTGEPLNWWQSILSPE